MDVDVKVDTVDNVITDNKKENIIDKDNNRDKDNFISKDKEHDIKENPDENVVLDGEVTMRRVNGSSLGGGGSSASNGADKENTSPDKQLDDEVKIEVIKQERDNMITPPVDDFDAMKVLEWDNKGVGKLPGSDLKVCFI